MFGSTGALVEGGGHGMWKILWYSLMPSSLMLFVNIAVFVNNRRSERVVKGMEFNEVLVHILLLLLKLTVFFFPFFTER